MRKLTWVFFFCIPVSFQCERRAYLAEYDFTKLQSDFGTLEPS